MKNKVGTHLAGRGVSFKQPVLLFSSLPLLFATSALAQTPLDAGALRQQIQRDMESALPPREKSDTVSPALVPQKKGDVSVTVKQFRFKGATLLSDKELQAAVKGYLNRPVSFADLQNAAAAVGDAYRAQGWIVYSYLPNQDIPDGVVTIEVREALFGKTKPEEEGDTWLDPQCVIDRVAAQQKSGQYLSSHNLDRALLLLDDLPGVAASGRLTQGAKDGETDMAIKLVKEAPVTGMIMGDNNGARATGEERAHGYAQFASPLGMGDQSSVYLLYSEGMRFAQLSESFPVGYDGLRVGVSGSLMSYDLVPDEFDALEGKGSSGSMGVDASYPIIRAREGNLYLDGRYDYRTFLNKAQGITASHYQTHSVSAILRGNLFDDFAGGGGNSASAAIVAGTLDQGTLDASENPLLDGRYQKIVYEIARTQTITRTISFYAGYSGQISRDNVLDTSEMFYLGGPSGVQAYPVSEAGGVSGHLLNAVLRWQFAPGFQASGFYDYGYVFNPGAIKDYGLQGAGLSLGWQADSGFGVKSTWAHRINDNPNPAANGDDQDGSKIENRFWIALSQRF